MLTNLLKHRADLIAFRMTLKEGQAVTTKDGHEYHIDGVRPDLIMCWNPRMSVHKFFNRNELYPSPTEAKADKFARKFLDATMPTELEWVQSFEIKFRQGGWTLSDLHTEVINRIQYLKA